MRAWMLGLFRWPRLEVVCRGSCPSIRLCELINLHNDNMLKHQFSASDSYALTTVNLLLESR